MNLTVTGLNAVVINKYYHVTVEGFDALDNIDILPRLKPWASRAVLVTGTFKSNVKYLLSAVFKDMMHNMYDEQFVNEKYANLTDKQLETTLAEINEEITSLTPAVERSEALNSESYEVEKMLSLWRIRKGTETGQDLKDIMLYANSNRELHQAINEWVERFGSKDVSIVPLSDDLYGSSEYCLVPFQINLFGGVTNEIVDAVTNIAEKINGRGKNRTHDTIFRVLRSSLYLIVKSTPNDDGVESTAECSKYSHSTNHHSDDYKALTIREALESAYQDFPAILIRTLKRDLEYYEEDNNVEEIADTKNKLAEAEALSRKIQAEYPSTRRKFLGIF